MCVKLVSRNSPEKIYQKGRKFTYLDDQGGKMEDFPASHSLVFGVVYLSFLKRDLIFKRSASR